MSRPVAESGAHDDPPPLVLSSTMVLIAAGRRAQRRLDAELAEHGISLRHVGALGHLGRDPELSYTELSRRAGITVQSMHATVSELVALGAVRAGERTLRGRRARLELTEHGRELVRTAAGIAARLDAELDPAGVLSPAVRAALMAGVFTV